MGRDIVQLTQHDGKRIGLPPHTAVCILEVDKHEQAPKAKTLLSYSMGMNQTGAVWVRDDYDQVLNLFPMAIGNVGWTHARELASKLRLSFPAGAIGGYVELDEGFKLMLDVPQGPLPVEVAATFEQLQAMMGENPPAVPESRPTARRAAPKPASAGKAPAKAKRSGAKGGAQKRK